MMVVVANTSRRQKYDRHEVAVVVVPFASYDDSMALPVAVVRTSIDRLRDVPSYETVVFPGLKLAYHRPSESICNRYIHIMVSLLQ